MDDKYSSCAPFDGKTYDHGTADEQLRQLAENLEPLIQFFVESLPLIIESVIANVTCYWDEILKSHPNKRIVHLAFHHKKERVRKKNRGRIAKDISKWVNADV